MNFNEALAYVRTYSAEVGDTYDANGVVHLMLAALDNLSEHFIEADLAHVAESATADQRSLLIKLGRFLEQRAAAR